MMWIQYPRSRATLYGLAFLTAGAALAATPVMAQIRFEFQPPRRVIVTPQVRVYKFGARNHADALAVQLAQQANAICLEMHRNYRHNPGFRETYAEMYQVLQDAKHIHELVHNNYHRSRREGEDHIARDLHAMDELFHHIEEDIARWTPATTQQHFHHGAVHGQSQNLRRLMQNFSETLHHMMTDYGVRSQIASGEAPPPNDLIAPPPGRDFPIRPRP